MTQRQEIAVREQFNFVPTTLQEAKEYATIFANSGLCPEAYKGRPNDILIVWQMGKELGLDKMQSLRTLGCINGMPFAYGDGLLALVKRHNDFEDMKEWFEGNLEKGDLIAFCTIKRKGNEAITQKFSIEDAKRAGLWGKKGPWQTYPKRMLQHRARGFAAKDSFPDALFGLMTQAEIEDIQVEKKIVEIKGKGINGLAETLGVKEKDEVIDATIVEDKISKYEELKNLIMTHKLKPMIIKKSLKACKVTKVKDLTEKEMDKWINFLKRKEATHAI